VTDTAPLPHPALAAGNVAVITGGASGIGLAAAHRFAAMGLKVVIADRTIDLVEAAAAAVGSEAIGIRTDVSEPGSIDRLAITVAAHFGPVAVLMNNAGVAGGADALSSPESWARVLGVNLMGVLHGVQRFVPAMIESGSPGLVINTGSKQGITQPPGDTAYNVSKAGVKALTEGLAHSLREQTGDRVTAHLLIPGFTYTGMTARRLPEKPPAAWTPEQVVDRLLESLARRDFYILCPDNETSAEQDAKRILWAARDIIENRPALSRWHPDWKEAFARYMAD
jgi:NAD(P)-dependent dehydrogenase (short-subunit alcohol dehydrogenase family)